MLAPVLSVVLAVILGGVVALIGKKVIGMKIPVLVTGTMELTGAAALSILGFSAAIAGSYTMSAILQSVVVTGFYWITVYHEHHGYPAPIQRLFRTTRKQSQNPKTGCIHRFISMSIVGLLAMGSSSAWWVISIIGALAWFITFRMFLQASKDEAASVAWSGLWPKEEEH
jgi:tetrahydromethanopterin S-methyltransferase subunit C